MLGGGGSHAVGAELEFNAQLSLTGSCATSSSDPVPDPPVQLGQETAQQIIECEQGPHPPKGRFFETRSIAVDSFGDIYVSSRIQGVSGLEARIDVFDPTGAFITEVVDPNGAGTLAVDSKGFLYSAEVGQPGEGPVLSRFNPIIYKPDTGEIEYSSTPTILIKHEEGTDVLPFNAGIAVDASDDHLLVDFEVFIAEYSSAEEGNNLLTKAIGKGSLNVSKRVSIDSSHRKIYASVANPDPLSLFNESKVLVFEADPPYALLKTIDGSNTPAGEFLTTVGYLSTAVDELTGNFFVDDINSTAKKVYEFNEAGDYIATFEHSFEAFPAEIEVDNAEASPNREALFVPSNNGNAGHSYAFTPKIPPKPPIITGLSFANVTDDEAELRATIDPNGLPTHYAFEYTTQQRFGEEGFAGAATTESGELGAESEATNVSALLTSLTPGTAYRFRVVADNECEPSGCKDEKEAGFTTFAEAGPSESCPNEELRIGASRGLPDCRAYELVTPPDTNGRTPIGVGFVGSRFTTLETSPQGEKMSFLTEGGSLPGIEGTGAFNGDLYLATRRERGWSIASAGPNGEESQAPAIGSVSADQGYAFWETLGATDQGNKVIGGESTTYIRYPDGDSELVGRGSLGFDSRVKGNLITEDASHIVFSTASFGGHIPVQLEPNAPPTGTEAVYDRTPDEVTHVVSLLPGNKTPAAGQNATFLGASDDGAGLAFSIGGTLYLRLDNSETFEVGKGVSFAGVAEGGGRVFYVENGDLFAFDAETDETTPFTESGDIAVVNISTDGSAAYFVSPTVLTGAEENPNGSVAEAGKQNLYFSKEGSLHFVATVTDRDVEGDETLNDGLGLWMLAIQEGRLARDSSRSTPNGSVLLFQSRADLSGYDTEGHTEIYRYDVSANSLACISCNPTLAPAVGNASLQSIQPGQGSDPPFSANGYIPNLRDDGRRAFFQTVDPLVMGDTDGLQDVYEWEAKGVGSCKQENGCVYLLSSGHSARVDYLYAISASGDDVFFRTSDLLLPLDRDATPSIYDARVDGGFAEEPESICEGEGCKPSLTPPPPLPTPESAMHEVEQPEVCPKGKHKIRRNGKVRCVKKHHKKSSRHKRKR